MTIRAKYSGKCAKCGQAINPGDAINWDKDTKRTEHVDCPEKVEIPQATKTYNLSGGSGYGCQGWFKDEVVRASDMFRQRTGAPEWLYVMSAEKHYVYEDGMTFGVGDESGYQYFATCREATPEEAAPAIAKREQWLKVQAAKTRIVEIQYDIQKRGERPAKSDDNANGERMFDTMNPYGRGYWFVVNETEIWYVKNNGADGDAWEWNNVRTGGAGAIGWMIPRDEALAAELRELAEILK